MALRHRAARRLRSYSVNALIPSALTVLGLSMGLTAIRFGLQERWELAVGAIIAAAIIDGLDGRVARILKASTVFGAELDSLSDFLCFGVAPGMLLYLWSLQPIGGAGWAVALLFAVCVALRLARFNASLADPERPAWTSHFFTGMPAPSAGCIALMPMMLSFNLGDAVFRQPVLVAPFAIFVALLAVSTIPMYSGKGIKIQSEHMLPVLLAVGLLFAALVGYPWYTLVLMGLGFFVSIPFSVRAHRRFRAQALADDAAGDDISDRPRAGNDGDAKGP